MRRRSLGAGLLVLAVGLVTGSGCHTVLIGKRTGEALGRPIVLETPSEARGQLVYMKHCYRCHQMGEGGLAPVLNLPLPRLAARTQIRIGAGAMPAFPPEVISDAELDDLLDYLKAQRRP